MTENRVIEILTDKHTIFDKTICNDIAYKKLNLAYKKLNLGVKTATMAFKKLKAANERYIVKKRKETYLSKL